MSSPTSVILLYRPLSPSGAQVCMEQNGVQIENDHWEKQEPQGPLMIKAAHGSAGASSASCKRISEQMTQVALWNWRLQCVQTATGLEKRWITGNEQQESTHSNFSFWIFCILCPLVSLFLFWGWKTCRKQCYISVKLREWQGHFKTIIFFCWSHLEVVLMACVKSLSCCIMQIGFSSWSAIDGWMDSPLQDSTGECKIH